MERELFRTVDFDLGRPIAYRFLRRYARVSSILSLLKCLQCKHAQRRAGKSCKLTLLAAMNQLTFPFSALWTSKSNTSSPAGSGYNLTWRMHVIVNYRYYFSYLCAWHNDWVAGLFKNIKLRNYFLYGTVSDVHFEFDWLSMYHISHHDAIAYIGYLQSVDAKYAGQIKH